MTERIGDYRKPIACIACGQSQQPTILWLTCEYCSIVLEEHPYFRGDDDTDNSREGRDCLGRHSYSLPLSDY